MKPYSIKRVGIFNIIARFPTITFTYFGTLFTTAVLTQAQADEINTAFPNSVFPQ